jgi:glycyl-tRNA synthetase beta chain
MGQVQRLSFDKLRMSGPWFLGRSEMTDFLLELRCEEVPARMQAGARRDLEKLFREHMRIAGITLGEITVWSTPRRLALIAKSLPDTTAAVSEELKGPKLGAPPQALEGFLRKTGLIQDQLTERDGVYFAISEKPGRATADVLAEAIPAIIRAFPWPKSQRWGAASISTESLRWVRPLSGIVAIFGQDLVECAVGDVRSGFATKGHRFHAPGEITIGGASDYQDKLRACHVIVDHTEREALICTKASAAATAAGLVLVEDEGLVIENAGLTEWPVPLLGRFDAEYLEVPPEVIQLTARTNQKYFVCEQHGKLANAFVCTANIEAADGGAEIVSGNRKVLAARLSDARFFWQQDRKKTLAQHAEGLARITFHEKLGTVADKVERVAKLARWLVEEGIVKSSPLQGRGLGEGAVAYAQRQGDSPHPNPSPEEEGLSRAALADQTELAARLCKADLVTEMVGEFPELQGLMGGYYARAEGLDNAVADAIRDHYKPVGQGDDVPTAPVTVAVSLADKLDTLFGFFAIDEKPTGSKDPFALRRASLAIIAVILATDLRFDVRFVFMEIASVFIRRLDQRHTSKLGEMLKSAKEAVVSLENMADIMVAAAREVWKAHGPVTEEQIKRSRYLAAEVYLFLFDRLKVQQRETGVRHDLIDAVFALGGEDDLVRLLARVHALQAFVGSPDGTNLLAGYKRAANILKKEQFDSGPFSLSYMPEPAEQALIDALAKAAPQAAVAVEAERFSEAMAALASLRAPIDAFFDSVTVNDADPQKRAARLSLLAQFRDAVHSVADFSKIEG